MELRVVLVEPRYDGNIGSVARVMKNFGFRNLVLVNPGPIGDFGLAMAAHARDLLAGARVVSTLVEALEGANLIVGTSGKRLGPDHHHLRLHLRVPALTPRDLAEKLRGKEGEVALLLGREDLGLSREELMRCDMLVSIPTSPEYPVMNLSHSASIILYELGQLDNGPVTMASRESLDLIFKTVERILYLARYPKHKVSYMVLMLRRVLGRAEITDREARTILGVQKKLIWRLEVARDLEKESKDPEITSIVDGSGR